MTMERIDFYLSAIPDAVRQDIPQNYGAWGQKLSQGADEVTDEIGYQQRQNVAMRLLYLAFLSLAMWQQLGYSTADIEWLLETERREKGDDQG